PYAAVSCKAPKSFDDVGRGGFCGTNGPYREFSILTRCVVVGREAMTEYGSGYGSGYGLRVFGSGRIGDGFVHQHDRNSVPDRIDAAALGALQTLSFVFQRQRLFAHRAHQDVEQVLGNHGEILRDFSASVKAGKSLTAGGPLSAVSAPLSVKPQLRGNR